MDIFLTLLGLMLVCVQCSAQKLSPTGRNVCFNTRDSSPICCSGWSQQGDECTVPLCEGERACLQDEVCVYPGFCRCKPGYFGYQCKTPCPPEFWGPDCCEVCPCHPYGLCDPVTGECSCFLNRWGNLCQNSCKCGRHGKCDPVYGNCTCEEGWWTSTCSKACQCHPSTSTCDQATGRCLCNDLYWGQKCSLRCNCYISPCQQRTGECQCLSGWWGPSCDRRCNCNLSHADCLPSNGTCLCHPGYKSPFCHEPSAKPVLQRGDWRWESCSPHEASCLHCAGQHDFSHAMYLHVVIWSAFNHSFIEQPSSGWVTDSFETDDDGEAVYCEPPPASPNPSALRSPLQRVRSSALRNAAAPPKICLVLAENPKLGGSLCSRPF